MTVPVSPVDSVTFGPEGFIESEQRCARSGKILAVGPYLFSAAKFESLFTFNDARRAMFQNLCNWIAALRADDVQLMALWFVGSFTERIDKPADIDVIAFHVSKEGSLPRSMDREHVFDMYGIDLVAMSMRENPANLLHNLARYLTYFSNPSGHKSNTPATSNRKAVISLLGPEILNLSTIR